MYNLRKSKEEDTRSMVEIDKTYNGKSHWSENTFKSEVNNNCSEYFSLFFKDSVIGYIGYWKILDEGHITTVAICQNHAGRNLSDVLLYKVIDTAYKSSIKWLTLEVRVSNFKAIGLYKKYGFNQIGVRKAYYQDNKEDAIILWSGDIQSNSYISACKETYQKTLKENSYNASIGGSDNTTLLVLDKLV